MIEENEEDLKAETFDSPRPKKKVRLKPQYLEFHKPFSDFDKKLKTFIKEHDLILKVEKINKFGKYSFNNGKPVQLRIAGNNLTAIVGGGYETILCYMKNNEYYTPAKTIIKEVEVKTIEEFSIKPKDDNIEKTKTYMDLQLDGEYEYIDENLITGENIQSQETFINHDEEESEEQIVQEKRVNDSISNEHEIIAQLRTSNRKLEQQQQKVKDPNLKKYEIDEIMKELSEKQDKNAMNAFKQILNEHSSSMTNADFIKDFLLEKQSHREKYLSELFNKAELRRQKATEYENKNQAYLNTLKEIKQQNSLLQKEKKDNIIRMKQFLADKRQRVQQLQEEKNALTSLKMNIQASKKETERLTNLSNSQNNHLVQIENNIALAKENNKYIELVQKEARIYQIKANKKSDQIQESKKQMTTTLTRLQKKIDLEVEIGFKQQQEIDKKKEVLRKFSVQNKDLSKKIKQLKAQKIKQLQNENVLANQIYDVSDSIKLIKEEINLQLSYSGILTKTQKEMNSSENEQNALQKKFKKKLKKQLKQKENLDNIVEILQRKIEQERYSKQGLEKETNENLNKIKNNAKEYEKYKREQKFTRQQHIMVILFAAMILFLFWVFIKNESFINNKIS